MLPGLFRKLFFIFTINVFSVQLHAADVDPLAVFENKACVECHEKNNPQLIKDWQFSAHASTKPVINCVSCHGKSHQLAASLSRHDSVCIDCHGGRKDPVVHSYTSSKHGVIMQLEKNSYDWQQPLAMANYRAPGCAYCHMHQAAHNVSDMARSDLMDKNAAVNTEIKVRDVCQDCHAPRYITRLLINNENMLDIARKKVREADKLIAQAAEEFSDKQLLSARKIMTGMLQHLKNVYLGGGHQSPDYQWWHGQPALDGDLLRIKGAVGELQRRKKMANQ